MGKKQLSAEFDILLNIYKDTILYKDKAYFKKLVIETGCDEMQISNMLEYWLDKQQIYRSVEKVNGRKVFCYNLGDDFMGFIKGLYDTIQDTNLKENQVSTDLCVLLQIYEDNTKQILSTNARLMKVMGLTRSELLHSIEKLSHYCMIEEKTNLINKQKLLIYFEKNVLGNKIDSEQNVQVSSYYVDNKILPWVKGHYNVTQKVITEDNKQIRVFKPYLSDKQTKLDDFEEENTLSLK